MNHFTRDFKQLAHDLIDKLPDNATWPDLIDRAAERQDTIETAEVSDYDDGTETPGLQDYDRLLVERSPEEDENTISY